MGELKVKKATGKKYTYYHCTGYRGKCGERYTREARLEESLCAALKEIVVPPAVVKWLQDAVSSSDLTEHAAREREVKRLQQQQRGHDATLETLYSDRLGGIITVEQYQRRSQDIRGKADGLARRIEELRNSAPAPVQDAINLMDLTSRAADLFAVQPVHEKQAFLRLVLKSASWIGGELRTEFESPFENLRVSNRLSQTNQKEIEMKTSEDEIWLPR